MATILETYIEEAADATAFKIYDKTTGWGDDIVAANVTAATLTITYEGADYTYELIIGANKDKWNEFLSDDGHEVVAADITDFPGVIFTDGKYYILLEISDGATDLEYENKQAFLAQNRCRARRLPLKIGYPDLDYELNKLIFALIAWLYAAETSVELAHEDEFDELIERCNTVFDQYGTAECF